MDVLSDVLAVLRTGRPRAALTTWTGRWAQEFAPVDGAAGFHLLLRGSCWLLGPDTPPLRLSPGDIVFRPHGTGHILADDPAALPQGPPCRPGTPTPRAAARQPPAHQREASEQDADQPEAQRPEAQRPEAQRPEAQRPEGPQPGFPQPEALRPATPPQPAIPQPDVTTDPRGETAVLCGAYEVDPAVVHPLLRGLPAVIHLPARAGRHAAVVELIGGELVGGEGRPGAEALLPALLDVLLVHVLRECLARTGGWAAALADPVTAAALDAIHRDPSRGWTVASLAAETRLSRAAFARRFTERVGEPPLTYLTRWRMTTAGRMLRQGDATLGAVAARVGYTSEFAFAAAFKRHHGVAPGRYRRGLT